MSIDPSRYGWGSGINNINNNCSHENRAAVVFLHGLGDTADGWSSLEQMIPSICPRLSSDYIHYAFPQAPTIGITLNGGMRVPGWFDLYDWPIDSTSRDDYHGQIKAVHMLEEEIELIEREEGIPASRIVVGGFAQGAALAMLSAFSRRERGKEPYAGCVCLSGWLPMCQKFRVNGDESDLTPLFWAHGEYDDIVRHEQQMFGVRKLRDRGVDVTVKSYPVGHESCDYEEIEAMAEFIDDVLYPKVDVRDLQQHEHETYQPHGNEFIEAEFEYVQDREQNYDESSTEFLASVQYLFDQNPDQFHP